MDLLDNPKGNQKKQLLLKSGITLLGVGLLSACQTISTPKPQANFASHSTVANGSMQVESPQEAQAKKQLAGAMSALLGRERTSVTEYYYQAEPLQGDNNLNAGSDSLFETITKVFGYKKSEQKNSNAGEKPYRTMADYTPLGDNKALYLRYYDEKDGTKPAMSYNINRLDGMSERMQATDAVVYQLNKGYQACVQSLSYEVDGLVDGNPAITSDDKAIKSALATFDTCTKEQDTIANRLRNKPISAYHRQDISMGFVCASNYRRSLMDALSPNRTLKRYDKKDSSYDAYDSVYAQYGICHSVFMNSYRSDPVVYMNNGDSETRLEGLKAARKCGIEFTDGVAALYQAGMSYKTHATRHQGLVYTHIDCLMDSAEKFYNEDGEYTHALASYETPANRNEMADALALYQEIATAPKSRTNSEEEQGVKGLLGGFFDKYFAMKKEELAKADKQDDKPNLDGLDSNVYTRMANDVFKSMASTPEQIQAKNYYAYNHTKLSVLAKHQPNSYKSDVLLSLDFESPTATQSLQLPFSQDFKNAKIAVDVNAVLPLMAVLAPEQTPLASEFKGDVGVMNFALPKSLQGVVPMDLVYQSVIKGFLGGLENLHDSNFGMANISQDSFAKQKNASSAVKVNMNLQQSGELLAYISKQVIKDLNDYVEKNPKIYAEKSTDNLGVADSISTKKANEQKQKIKHAIEQWALLDKGFISADVGGLFQVIDGILPMDYHQSNYYYFDNGGNLVGQVVRQDMGDHFGKTRTKMLAMTSFQTNDFNAHALAKKVTPLTDTFSFDGNTWLSEQNKVKEFKKEAKSLREGYTADGEQNQSSEP